MVTRRQFLKISALAAAGMAVRWKWDVQRAFAQIPGGTLPPGDVAKFVTPLVKPPVFRRTGKIKMQAMKNAEYYEIAMKEFQQQILPNVPGVTGANHPMTTVWSYGPAAAAPTLANGYFYPAFTIENKWRKPSVVKWVNGLDPTKPHLLPVDPALHWANPIGMRDMAPDHDPDDEYWDHDYVQGPNGSYTGPVPMVTHVHGAHTFQESDGYPEAWYLPAGATGVNWTTGTYYDNFNPGDWGPGFAVFGYPNDQRATTLWYHDHTLGMTRVNVYAGPAGFYLIRGGPDDQVIDGSTGMPAVLPGPAPGKGIDPFGLFYEIPIAIQDRSFNADGSLFYPDHRAFFEGLNPADFDANFPFIPSDDTCDGLSDVAKIWQPEFFGNMTVVNGQTWPFLEVEPQLYRFRLLNGCNSRFLVLEFENPAVQVWQIGAEGGFLDAPKLLNDFPPDGSAPGGTAKLLMGPAERADVIVDFRAITPGTPGATFRLLNLGPDEPFGGFPTPAADPTSTGQVMEFRVLAPGPMSVPDGTFTEPANLVLPAITPLVPTFTRPVSLNEEESATVKAVFDDAAEQWVTPVVLDCDDGVPFGPTAALLGTYDPGTGTSTPMRWMDAVSENPGVGATEMWEIYNLTMDAHPIHIHLVQFQVVDRQPMAGGPPRPPEAWETGFKDTVIAYPDEITRVQATFDYPGLYVWHCHIVEHEDNEMMRPYRVGP
jgi:spore coat protein A